MLVLSRQRDQVIMIGDDIEVVIVDIRGDKVRLGITAPKDVTVHRKEVYDQIKRENAAAATLTPSDLPAEAPQATSSSQPLNANGGNRRSSPPPRRQVETPRP
jgi:carbon storage regulator